MADRNDELTTARRRLPDLRLPPLGGGSPVAIRPRGRTAPILVLVHSGGCPDCRAYLDRLAEHRSEIEEWDGRVIAIVTGAGADSADGAERWADTPFPVVSDPEGRIAAALAAEAPALAIVDQWGEIHAAEAAGEDHQFLDPAKVVEWGRYLAIQCPECEGEAL